MFANADSKVGLKVAISVRKRTMTTRARIPYLNSCKKRVDDHGRNFLGENVKEPQG